jgi:hypothetical protein
MGQIYKRPTLAGMALPDDIIADGIVWCAARPRKMAGTTTSQATAGKTGTETPKPTRRPNLTKRHATRQRQQRQRGRQQMAR